MCISRSYFISVLLNKNVLPSTQSLAAHTQRQLWERARLHRVVLNCEKGMCGKTFSYLHICATNIHVIFNLKKVAVYFRKVENNCFIPIYHSHRKRKKLARKCMGERNNSLNKWWMWVLSHHENQQSTSGTWELWNLQPWRGFSVPCDEFHWPWIFCNNKPGFLTVVGNCCSLGTSPPV